MCVRPNICVLFFMPFIFLSSFSILINKDGNSSRFVSVICGHGFSLANTLDIRGALVSGYCGYKSVCLLF